ncbi:MAG: acetyl-CoA carboxylase biotin carboxyl carrier protein [Myxococcota bacterium]|nr:acetyl-CoA carboxylase biotin carboxyl carrier protein [Myxococcota bacterium]
MELKRIESLLGMMQEYGLAELELEEGEDRVLLRMPTAAPVAVAPAAVSAAPIAAPAAGSSPAAEDGHVVKAPMVATFYRAAKPTAPPFVEVGDTVAAGQVLCILEAMKMMNEIEAEVGGKVAEILVENGQAVQFGQPLFRIV